MYRLAKELGIANVDMLARSLTAKQFREWQMFYDLEPFGEVRDDYRTASIVAMIANVNRDPKKRKEPYKLEDFLLKFGEQPPKKQQTWQQQALMLKMLAAAYSKG